jgi:hypothetical protein
LFVQQVAREVQQRECGIGHQFRRTGHTRTLTDFYGCRHGQLPGFASCLSVSVNTFASRSHFKLSPNRRRFTRESLATDAHG